VCCIPGPHKSKYSSICDFFLSFRLARLLEIFYSSVTVTHHFLIEAGIFGIDFVYRRRDGEFTNPFTSLILQVFISFHPTFSHRIDSIYFNPVVVGL
jgi:hypothetical protein